MSYIKKICLYLLLLAVLSGLLSGCITKSDARADPGTSPGTEGTTDPEADSLTRQLEDLRNSLRQQTDSLEARVRALEEALQAGVPAGGNASDFTYEVIDGGIRLTGWTGTGKSLTVPQTVDGKPVTAIADGAFRDRSLESVTVPEGVVSVGWFAFSGCYRLSFVRLPASVTTIGYGAFENCASGLRFSCPSGSYASRYASSYGIPTSVQ